MVANFSNSMSTYNHPLWTALLDNDNHDWTPQRPIRMYYCTGDEQVTFQNAIAAEATMQANGANDVQAVNMVYQITTIVFSLHSQLLTYGSTDYDLFAIQLD